MTTDSEQIIKDIEDMKVKGAYLITKVALEALGMRAGDSPSQRDGRGCPHDVHRRASGAALAPTAARRTL